jgi:hypothetical protein
MGDPTHAYQRLGCPVHLWPVAERGKLPLPVTHYRERTQAGTAESVGSCPQSDGHLGCLAPETSRGARQAPGSRRSDRASPLEKLLKEYGRRRAAGFRSQVTLPPTTR